MKSFAVKADLEEELSQSVLEVSGTIPKWLSGTLIRNGPINFTINGEKIAHEFDGLAMLHAFDIHEGKVLYTNKFLRTDAYKTVFKEGSLKYVGFAVDPCQSIFRRLFTWLLPHPLQNANINVAKYAEAYVALTEVPLPVQFDRKTLETLGVFDFQDALPKCNSWESAHPHPQTDTTLNYLIQYGSTNKYVLYELRSSTRKVLAEIPVKEPAYMHSFAITENYAIFVEFPFFVNPLDLLLGGKPFIKNFTWNPEKGTQFLVVNRFTGQIVKKFLTKPFFAFHHVNAYESDDQIKLDIVTYENATIVSGLSDYFSINNPYSGYEQFPTQLERFELDLKKGSITSKTVFDKYVELPRINSSYDGKPYQFAYLTDPRDIVSKDDVRPLYKIGNEKVLEWSEVGCYPGEPVFVASPGAKNEDEGVVLSLIFDPQHHRSFLLILDGQSFKEIGRTIISHAIPPGLHGQFFY